MKKLSLGQRNRNFRHTNKNILREFCKEKEEPKNYYKFNRFFFSYQCYS